VKRFASGAACALLFVLFVIGCSGCSSKPPELRGRRVAGLGLVTLDGEPLEQGRIVMISDQGHGQVKAAADIVDGVFTFDEDSGPLEGEVRVEIHAVAMELEDFEARRAENPSRLDYSRIVIPAAYNVQSTLTATVSEDGGIVPVNFDLVSHP